MRYLIGILILSGFGLQAQSEKDFESFSRDLYLLITDTAALPKLEYIRVKTYEQHINEQDWSSSKKELELAKLREYYPFQNMEFQRRLGLLVDRYQREIDRGAQSEYLDHSFEADPKWKNRYQASFSMLYQYEGMQSVVRFEYQLYYSGKALIFIGDSFKEVY